MIEQINNIHTYVDAYCLKFLDLLVSIIHYCVLHVQLATVHYCVMFEITIVLFFFKLKQHGHRT